VEPMVPLMSPWPLVPTTVRRASREAFRIARGMEGSVSSCPSTVIAGAMSRAVLTADGQDLGSRWRGTCVKDVCGGLDGKAERMLPGYVPGRMTRRAFRDSAHDDLRPAGPTEIRDRWTIHTDPNQQTRTCMMPRRFSTCRRLGGQISCSRPMSGQHNVSRGEARQRSNSDSHQHAAKK